MRTLAINGVSQSINNTSKHFHTNGDIHDGTSSLDDISLLDQFVITEDDNTDIVRLQVEGHTLEAGAEFHHLLGLDVLKSIYTSNTVSDGKHTTSLLKIDSGSSPKNWVIPLRPELNS